MTFRPLPEIYKDLHDRLASARYDPRVDQYFLYINGEDIADIRRALAIAALRSSIDNLANKVKDNHVE